MYPEKTECEKETAFFSDTWTHLKNPFRLLNVEFSFHTLEIGPSFEIGIICIMAILGEKKNIFMHV